MKSQGRYTDAALELLKRLLKNQPVEPERITTDGLTPPAASKLQASARSERASCIWRARWHGAPAVRRASICGALMRISVSEIPAFAGSKARQHISRDQDAVHLVRPVGDAPDLGAPGAGA
jgi:hypothetical protein